MLASLAFNATGGQQCHSLFDQTASDRWATHTETEQLCFGHSDAFAGEVHSASCELKENCETQRQNIYNCIYFSLSKFGGKAWFPLYI